MRTIKLKNLFFLILAVLFFASCSKEQESVPVGDAGVLISQSVPFSPDSCVMSFVPSDEAVKVVYGIVRNEQQASSFPYDMEKLSEQEGNSEFKVTFSNLDSGKDYAVCAVAYDSNGIAGPVSCCHIMYADQSFSMKLQYVTDVSAGVTLNFTSGYYEFAYFLGKEQDRDAFLAGELECEYITESVVPSQTLNFFGLNPENDYVLYVRGYDRKGIGDEYREVAFTTCTADACPKVEFGIKEANAFKGKYSLESNGKCGKIVAFVTEKGDYDIVINHSLHFHGDIIWMLDSWSDIDYIAEWTTGEELILECTTPDMVLETPMEIYALVYDKDMNPAGVYHFDFATPAFNSDAPSCTVGIEIADITSVGATYTYTPDENVMGFMYDTVDAAWYDDIKNNSGEWHEYYIHETLWMQGYYWAYKDDFKDKKIVFKEELGTPNTKYYAVACPMNENGLEGWQPAIWQEYTTMAQ